LRKNRPPADAPIRDRSARNGDPYRVRNPVAPICSVPLTSPYPAMKRGRATRPRFRKLRLFFAAAAVFAFATIFGLAAVFTFAAVFGLAAVFTRTSIFTRTS